MDINFDDISKMFGKKAKEYAGDKEKTGKLLRDAAKKANDLEKKKGPLEEIWDNIQLLFGMVKDWISGEYKEIPVGSIVVIIMGLLYFVSPVDIIPDFIPGGLVDDALVLGLVIKQVKSDIEKYKAWKESY